MLRNLTMGLLLANLLLFIWGSWIVAPDVTDPLAFGVASEARLVLIERAGRADEADGGQAQVVARCFRLGPFASADVAAGVGDRLSARGMGVEITNETGRIWVGHWVQLLDLPSLDAAAKAVKKLVSKGIGDAYISSREPTVDISLGVFRGRQGADDVIRLARNLGYTAGETDRYRDGIEHWVEVELPADQPTALPPDLADMPLAQPKSGEAQIIRVEDRSCAPEVTVVGAGDVNEDGTEADVSLESPPRETGSPELSQSSTMPE